MHLSDEEADFKSHLEWASTHPMKDEYIKHMMCLLGLSSEDWSFLGPDGDPDCDLCGFNEWLYEKGEPTWATWTPEPEVPRGPIEDIEDTKKADPIENGANDWHREGSQRWQGQGCQ